MGRPRSPSPRTSIANVRLTAAERAQMETERRALGFGSISEYVRFLHGAHRQAASRNGHGSAVPHRHQRPRRFHRTKYGTMYLGDSLGLMERSMEPNSVDLVMTSPPFGLVRKKSTAMKTRTNTWSGSVLLQEGFNRVLRPKGSLVIDIGGSWKPGMPVRSLYHFGCLSCCAASMVFICVRSTTGGTLLNYRRQRNG